MSKKSPFAIQTALKGIGGDPKSVRKLRSGDLLIETASDVHSKSFLIAKTFLDSTLTVTPHKSLNFSRGVMSESDLLCASEAETLEGLSDQGCYPEARKQIASQLSQSYAQVTKLSTATTTTQTDEIITKIVCPPLKLLQPLISVPKPIISSSVAAVNKSSTSTQAELVPSTSSVTVTSPSKSQPTNALIDTVSTASDNLSLPHLSHPQHALFLKRPPLHPIPYTLHPRIQLKLQNP
ncbi:uncharacterized protein TNCV_4645871 [Trichonephila clavipes]|nr:uncharacterized protein TNCV_4645871 [Trichonephila clavipes]